ncbi:MAG: tetratricopeptide repeat protein [Bacteroidota bacterium]
MKKLLLSIVGSFFLFGTSINAQTWNWPEDKAKAEEKNVLYTDALKSGNFRVAANQLNWLLVNAPDLNPSIYINGNKIYEGLEKEESDKKLKEVYADSSLLMYDLRIQYFNEKEEVLNRKAYDAYKYWKGRRDKYPDLYALFQQTFELNGNKVFDNNLVAYLDVIRRHKAAGGDLSDSDVIETYFQINEIIDYKLSNGGNGDRLEKYRDNLDKILVATVDVDCEFVENNLVPKMQENPDDTKLAKKVFQLMLTGKCTDSPSFLSAAKIIYEVEPAYGIAIVVAKKEAAAGNIDEAEKYYNEASTLTDDNIKKAEINYDLGNLYYSKGSYSKAREYARKALSEDPSKREAYNILGNAYYQSFNTCKEGESRVKDKAVYLAAYEAYQKAGNSSGMKNAEAQFPTIDEIFNETYQEGQKISTGCWIGETVTIRRRP